MRQGTLRRVAFRSVAPTLLHDTPANARLLADHRNSSFAEWFINSWQDSDETLHHKPRAISLGDLDDRMSLGGPSEEDCTSSRIRGRRRRRCASTAAAYQANMLQLEHASWKAVILASG